MKVFWASVILAGKLNRQCWNMNSYQILSCLRFVWKYIKIGPYKRRQRDNKVFFSSKNSKSDVDLYPKIMDRKLAQDIVLLSSCVNLNHIL